MRSSFGLVMLVVVGLALDGCAVTSASTAPICRSGDDLDQVISVEIPQVGERPPMKMWYCYALNERTATPELARAGLLASMAEAHIRRGDQVGGLQLFAYAYERMPDGARRAAIAFELAKRYEDPLEAARWLWRAVDYVETSQTAGEEYSELAESIQARLAASSIRVP